MKCDFLVVGSGIAGLNFALKASEFGKVCLITKKDLIESNTNFTQGGIAAVFSREDSFDLHVKDTLKAGDGLCDKDVVKVMVKEAPGEIENLLSIGADFDTKGKVINKHNAEVAAFFQGERSTSASKRARGANGSMRSSRPM